MSFLSSLTKGLGGALGGGLASLGIGAASNILSPGNSRGEERKNYKQDRGIDHDFNVKEAQLGRDMDVGAQQEMYDFRIQRGKEAGMTDYEMFMGPAGGAGGGTGAATSTLGNAGQSAGNSARQAATQQKIASEEKEKDRMTSLAQTAMQTDTQKQVAETQAGVNTQGQITQKLIADNKLAFDRETLTKVTLPQAAENIKKTEQQTAKLINEVSTSKPKFMIAMKQLSMGAENMLVEYYQRHMGISLADPQSWSKLSFSEREAILTQMLAYSSTSYKEGSGVASGFTNILKGLSEKGENQREKTDSFFSNIFNSDRAAPTLGKAPKARSSEPYQSGPNMNYR